MQTALIWVRYGKIQHSLGEHLIHWTCAVFSHIARKMNNVSIFSHDQVTLLLHNIKLPYIVLNLQLECDIECENIQYLYTSTQVWKG